MILSEVLHNWLPGSMPRKRRDLSRHMTHEWAIKMMNDVRVFYRDYQAADRLIVLDMLGTAMGDDFWNMWAEAASFSASASKPSSHTSTTKEN